MELDSDFNITLTAADNCFLHRVTKTAILSYPSRPMNSKTTSVFPTDASLEKSQTRELRSAQRGSWITFEATTAAS